MPEGAPPTSSIMPPQFQLLPARATQHARRVVKIRIRHPRGVAEQADLLTSSPLGNWFQSEIPFVHPHCVQRLMLVLEQRSQQSEPWAVQRWKDVTEYLCPIFGESAQAALDPAESPHGEGRGGVPEMICPVRKQALAASPLPCCVAVFPIHSK